MRGIGPAADTQRFKPNDHVGNVGVIVFQYNFHQLARKSQTCCETGTESLGSQV